ncbi:SET domain containing protein [Gracilaria domingensis]|nr:SET domain containing protein [Gracilaria domingensis]
MQSPFNGADQSVEPDWVCKRCGNNRESSQDRRLMSCSECKLVYYCSDSCQRQDHTNHEKECIMLTRQQFYAHQLEFRLAVYQVDDEGQEADAALAVHEGDEDEHDFDAAEPEPRNLFEEEVGRFWEFPDGKCYCTVRAKLAHRIEKISDLYEVAPLLETTVSHYMHALHLDIADHLRVRSALPFALLRLNQDERCVAFITHWLRRKVDPAYRARVESSHANSAVGDWIYGSADCYADIFHVVGAGTPKDLLQPHLAALCVVKARIIAKHRGQYRQLDSLQATGIGQQLGDAMTHVERFLVGDRCYRAPICEQDQQLGSYLVVLCSGKGLKEVECAFGDFDWRTRCVHLLERIVGGY